MAFVAFKPEMPHLTHVQRGINDEAGPMLRQFMRGYRFRRMTFAAGAVLLAAASTPSAMAQSLASYGATPGQVAVGAALDASSATGAAATLANAIRALPNAASRADALSQISAGSFTLVPALAIQSLDAIEANVHNSLVDRRDLDADRDTSGVGRFRLSLMGDLRQAHYSLRPDRPRANSDNRSLAVAIDYMPLPGVVVGVSLGVDGLDAQLANTRPRIAMDSYHIGPYLGVSNGHVYFDTSFNYASTTYNLRREVTFGGLDDRLSTDGTRDGDAWGVSAETGYQLRKGKVNIQPYAGLHYRYSLVSEIPESGGAAALDVSRYKDQSLRSAVGLRASGVIHKGSWSLQPSLSGEWRHELRGNVAGAIEARLVNTDGPAFTLTPDQPGRNAGLVTAGLAATYRDRATLRVSYRGEFAGDRRVNGFMATLSYRV